MLVKTELNHPSRFVRAGLLFDASISEQAKFELQEYFFSIFPNKKLNTLAAYDTDLLIYRNWCEDNSRPMISNDRMTMYQNAKGYTEFLVAKGNNKYTINRRLNTLSVLFKLSHIHNPIIDNVLFKDYKNALFTKLSGVQAQASAIEGDLLQKINDEFIVETALDVRDLALCNCMFDGLLRSNEVRYMRPEHIDRKSNSLFIPETKGDKTGKGEYRFISDTSIDMVNAWMEELKISDGYIWQPMHRRGTSKREFQDNKSPVIVPTTIYRAVKRVVKRVTGNGDGFSSHSFRIGAARTLAKHGVPTHLITQAGGWQTESMVIGYIRDISAGDSGASDYAKAVGR